MENKNDLTTTKATWLLREARLHRIDFMRDKAYNLIFAVSSNQGRSKQPGNVIASLKSVEPEFKAAIGRMRSPKKKQAAQAVLEELEKSLPKLIGLWQNETRLKRAINSITQDTEVLARYSFGYRDDSARNDAIDRIEEEHDRLMPLEKISAKELTGFLDLVRNFDRLYVLPKLRSKDTLDFGSRTYERFVALVDEIEVEAFVEDAYTVLED